MHIPGKGGTLLTNHPHPQYSLVREKLPLYCEKRRVQDPGIVERGRAKARGTCEKRHAVEVPGLPFGKKMISLQRKKKEKTTPTSRAEETRGSVCDSKEGE